jgi:hypothetical protein
VKVALQRPLMMNNTTHRPATIQRVLAYGRTALRLELGICGVSAAVANAIYNATGVRERTYPITLDKLLAAMPIPG